MRLKGEIIRIKSRTKMISGLHNFKKGNAIDELLKQENCTIESLLASDDLFDEINAHNPRLKA